MSGNSSSAAVPRSGALAFILVCFALGAQALSSNVAWAQAGLASAPLPPTSAPGTATVPLARGSDTIGEAADRQRTMRMLQSQGKSIAAAPDARVPAIVVERAAERAPAATPAGKPAEPQMVLTEVMRGPTKLLAGIELNGVNRFVTTGEDIGNGWRVVAIDKYRVVLQMEAPSAPPDRAAAKGASRSKGAGSKDVAAGSPAATRTLVLALGMRSVTAAGNGGPAVPQPDARQ